MNSAIVFANPWMLLTLIVPIVLAVYWRGADAAVPFPFDNVSHRSNRILSFALSAAHTLPLGVLFIASLILAEPQTLQTPEAQRKMTHIQICLDVSGSMSADDPPRYTHAQAAIDAFTLARDGDAMGLILFSDIQARLVPVTEDLAAIRSLLPLVDPQKTPGFMGGGTMIAAALRFTTAVMQAESLSLTGDRVIILVSDGQSADLGPGDQHEVASLLYDAGIKLFYLHIAQNEPPQQEVIDIARSTGGQAYTSSDRDGTLDVFRQIDRLTRSEFETLASRHVDGFRPFGVALLAVCGMHALSMFRLRYTPW